MRLTRRDFLTASAALGASVAANSVLAQTAQQPNQNNNAEGDRLNVAVIGVNGRGMDHVSGFANRHNCHVTVVCDCDSSVVGRAMTMVRERQGREPRYVQDLRRVMEDRTIHIISIATPNHWHALAAIWAMQNGKDVYVEKPVSHNVSEGRRIVEASRFYNKMCQTGTQVRSTQGTRDAIHFLRSGGLGRVQVARALCYKPRGSIGRAMGEQPIPESMDYDLWCGPAPRRALTRRRLHYDWHWTWDYGNGDLGNQGIHQMDVARWGLGKRELARSAMSAGGRWGYVDDGETANTQMCFFDYGDSKLTFEVRGLPTPRYLGANVGNIFHCADGYLVCTGYSTAIAYGHNGEVIRRFDGGEQHYGNFVQAVRTRRREVLNADIEEGHLSSALCHLANISHRLGRQVPFNPRSSDLRGQEEVNTVARMEEHLGDNGIDLNSINLTLGRRLTIDPRSETFVDDQEANRLLTREYRRGFEVPARIG